MTVAIGCDRPLSFSHTYQKQKAIIVFSIAIAIIIIVIICICLGCFSFQRIDCNNRNLILLPLTDLFKLIYKCTVLFFTKQTGFIYKKRLLTFCRDLWNIRSHYRKYQNKYPEKRKQAAPYFLFCLHFTCSFLLQK